MSSTAGCAQSSAPGEGELRLDLVGQAASGLRYRLRSASIDIAGPAPMTWNTEDEPDRTSLSADVVVGDYTATLHAGWRLEKLLDNGATMTVDATLVSANPVAFAVSPDQRTSVPLVFRVGEDQVGMGQGYDIIINVQEPTSHVIVAANVGASILPGSIVVYPHNATGNVAPIRQIIGTSTQIATPLDVKVAGNEIFEGDDGRINVFALDADGDVAPVRQIAGDNTKLTIPGFGNRAVQSLLVVNDEIFAATQTSVLVFPMSANGNVAPTRELTGLSNASSIAVHGDELYVEDNGIIKTFAITASGPATATRTLSANSGCGGGLAVAGDELFVASPCLQLIGVYDVAATSTAPAKRRLFDLDAAQRFFTCQPAVFQGELFMPYDLAHGISVYPVSAAGLVGPARTISGPRTQLGYVASVALH